MSGKVKVPFIITNEFLENPLFGYNLIEYLFQGTIQNFFDLLMSLFRNISLERAETMIVILQKVANAPDLLGEV